MAINEIDLEGNAVKIMGPYNRTKPLAQLIKQLQKERELAGARVQTISDAMMMLKLITLMAQTIIFSDDIREWTR